MASHRVDEISLPRTRDEAFCQECRLAFTLLEESPIRVLCKTCFEKLNRPAIQCDQCGSVILPGERFHLGKVRACRNCLSDLEDEFAVPFRTNAVAWRNREI